MPLVRGRGSASRLPGGTAQVVRSAHRGGAVDATGLGASGCQRVCHHQQVSNGSCNHLDSPRGDWRGFPIISQRFVCPSTALSKGNARSIMGQGKHQGMQEQVHAISMLRTFLPKSVLFDPAGAGIVWLRLHPFCPLDCEQKEVCAPALTFGSQGCLKDEEQHATAT